MPELKPYVFRTRVDVIGGVTKPPVNDGYYPVFREYRNQQKLNTPDYRKRLALNQRLPVNSYRIDAEHVRYPGGNNHLVLTWIPNGDTSYYSGPSGAGFGSLTYVAPTTAQRAAMIEHVRQKCRAKLKDQSVNLGNFLAERKQVFSMISSTATSLAKSFTLVRRGDLTGAFRALAGQSDSNQMILQKLRRINGKPFTPRGPMTYRSFRPSRAAADNWLQLQYGWKPLLTDVYGAAEALAKYQNPSSFPIQRVSSNTSWKDSRTQVGEYNAAGLVESVSQIQAIYHFTVDVRSARLLGSIGLTNPASILWEVTPYSFVVDWFLPVGNYLNNLDATLGLQFVDGCLTEKYRSTITLTNHSVYTVGNYRYQWACEGKATWETFSRSVENDFPSNSFPSFKSPFSAPHVANALALLVQAFSKH